MKLRILCALGLFLGAVGSQAAIEANRPEREEVFLYLPDRRAFRHLSFGHYGLLADLIFIRTNVYLKEQFKKRDFRYLAELYDTITTLDPYFTRAYYHGAVFLSSVAFRSHEGLRLLLKGIAADERLGRRPNPTFYMEAAAIFLIDMGDPQKAADMLREYVNHPRADDEGAKAFFRGFIERSSQIDPIAYGIRHWRRRIGLPRTPYYVNPETGETFDVVGRTETGARRLRSPKDGSIRTVSEADLNQRFERKVQRWEDRETGKVFWVKKVTNRGERVLLQGEEGTRTVSTDRLLDAYYPLFQGRSVEHIVEAGRLRLRQLRTRRLLRRLRRQITRYREQRGTFPETLSSLGNVPPPPIGGTWRYDPKTGSITAPFLKRDELKSELVTAVHRYLRKEGKLPERVSDLEEVTIPDWIEVDLDPQTGRVEVQVRETRE